MSKLSGLCLSIGLGLCAPLTAGPFATSRPVVVELFTSEGCSSCPPAEILLQELAQRSGVLALSFHVDYWDSLGWRDRFALADAVSRQEQYARSLGRPGVYTPQVVLDGRADYVGSDRRGIEAALTGSRTGVLIEIAVRDGALLMKLGGGQCLAPSDVLLIAYQHKAVSAIGRGENAGRTLQEFNIARSIRTVGHWNGSEQQLEVPLAALPTDATDVAVIVQAAGQGQIVGAASGSLH